MQVYKTNYPFFGDVENAHIHSVQVQNLLKAKAVCAFQNA